MPNPNDDLAAQFQGLSETYANATNTKIAPLLRKVAADLRAGTPRATVLRDMRALHATIDSPSATITRFMDQAAAHFGVEMKPRRGKN